MSAPIHERNSILDLEYRAGQLSLLDGSRWETIATAIRETDVVGGELWECGAYRGGTVLYMKARVFGSARVIRAFDTFAGLPFHSDLDVHSIGAIKSDYEAVMREFEGLDNLHVYRGVMPATFAELEDSVISVAHIDVDQYESVKSCLEWVYPRVHSGGWIIIDDYHCNSCPGAKVAVDAFLADKSEKLVKKNNQNPQAYFIKL